MSNFGYENIELKFLITGSFMEATSSPCPSIFKITKEVEKYVKIERKKREKGRFNSEKYIEKVNAILSKIELANKNENTSGRLCGLCTPLLNLTVFSEDLSEKKELIKVVSQHKSELSNRLAISMVRELTMHKIPGLDDCLNNGVLSLSGALDILNIKLKDIKEEKLKFAGGDINAFTDIAIKMSQGNAESETAMLVKFEMPVFFSMFHTITPIFLRKQEGKPLEILITHCDGVGMHIEIITNILQNLPIGVNVYTLTLARRGNCGDTAAFAVSDIIHYCKLKNQEIDLFEFAKQNASPMTIKKMDLGIAKSQRLLLKGMRLFRYKSKFYSFDTVPIKMMKLSASKKAVKQFLRKYHELKKEIVDAKTGETLKENIKRYSYGSPKVNCHTVIKSGRFISLLALKALEKEEILRAEQQSKED